MHKPTNGRLSPDFFQILLMINWGTQPPQIFKKVDWVQTGGRFQGSPHNELLISSRNTSENRCKDVIPQPGVQLSKYWGCAPLPKNYPIFPRNGLNHTFENSCAQKEKNRKNASLLIYSGPYSLSHSSKRGVSMSYPDLWEFCKNGDILDACHIYLWRKRSKYRRQFF
jgi:hypothetical protein